MNKIGIAANCSKDRTAEVLHGLLKIIEGLGMDLVADESSAAMMGGVPALEISRMSSEVDVVIALGGDGTMLRVVREMQDSDTPVMGFNIGSLGFMTSVAEDDFERALKCLKDDDYVVSERAMIDCVVKRDDGDDLCFNALNDIVVKCGSSARIANIKMSIADEEVASYSCDGLIISTPTGSTGHSLSSGGPILSPDTPAFVVSLICPHTLSSRPLVVPDTSALAIRPVDNDDELVLVVDGQIDVPITDADMVAVGKSERKVRFVHLSDHSYFSVLRQKLRWSEANR